MKNHFYVLVFMLSITNFMLGQNEINLSYNKAKNTIEKLDKTIKKGLPYKIKIKGINTALMTFSVTAKDKELVSPMPEVLKTLILDINNSNSIFKSMTGDSISGVTYTDHEKLFNASLLILNDLKIINEKVSAFNKAIRIKDGDIEKTKQLATECLTELDMLILEPKRKKITPVPKSKNSYKELYNYITQGIQNITSTREFMESRMNFRFSVENAMEEKFIQLHANLVAIESQIKVNKYLGYLKFIKNALDAKSEIPFDKLHYSRKDLLEVEVVMKDAFTKDTLLVQTVDVYTKGDGGVRLRFSSGFFYNDILDESYFLSERDDMTKFVIAEKAPDFDISVGALAHIGLKLSSKTDIAVNFGLAASPLDGNIRYLFGGGFLFGKKREFAISFGTTVSRINRLSGSVSKDSQGLYVPISVTSAPVVKQNKWGTFFGLTYNFKNVKK